MIRTQFSYLNLLQVLLTMLAFYQHITLLLAAFVCTCMTNGYFIHHVILWKMLGYIIVGYLITCIMLTTFYMPKIATVNLLVP